MTENEEKEVAILIEGGQWKEALDLYCLRTDLVPYYIEVEGGVKRVEIHFEGELMQSLQGTAPDNNFVDISQAILIALIQL